jgi:hypothetical protein
MVTADGARCRLDRIDTASGAPLALTDQRGHRACAPKSVAGSRSATRNTTSASVWNRPARFRAPPARRAAGRLARAVHEGQDAPPGIGAPERVTITRQEDRSAPGAAGSPLSVDEGRGRGRESMHIGSADMAPIRRSKAGPQHAARYRPNYPAAPATRPLRAGGPKPERGVPRLPGDRLRGQGVPADWSRSASALPIAVAGVRTPARAGRRSRSSARQRALSPSITDVAA